MISHNKNQESLFRMESIIQPRGFLNMLELDDYKNHGVYFYEIESSDNFSVNILFIPNSYQFFCSGWKRITNN